MRQTCSVPRHTLRKTAVEKRWGSADPRIVNAINEILHNQGYSSLDWADGSPFWKRKLTDDITIEIVLFPLIGTSKGVTFFTSFFISSYQVGRVKHVVKINECNTPVRQVKTNKKNLDAFEPETLISVDLDWFVRNENPNLPNEKVMLRVTQSHDDAIRVANLWWDRFEKYGKFVLDRIQTRTGLIELISSPNPFPKRAPQEAEAVRIIARWEALAILYALEGRETDALREVDTHVEEVRASVARRELQADAETYARCIAEKLRTWILKTE